MYDCMQVSQYEAPHAEHSYTSLPRIRSKQMPHSRNRREKNVYSVMNIVTGEVNSTVGVCLIGQL